MTRQPFRPVAMPLYKQVEHHLARRIQDGDWKPGDALPSEAELCKQFGVSRVTVRAAIDGLVRSRFVWRQQGSGTFVSDLRGVAKAMRLTGSLYDVHQYVSGRVLDWGVEAPPLRIAQAMKLAPGVPCRRMIAVNNLGDGPISLVHMYFPREVEDFINQRDIGGRMQPVVLVEMRSGRRLSHADQHFKAVIASDEVAAALGVAAGTPVLRMERVNYAEDGGVLEATEAYYHPDRYEIAITLSPERPAGGSGARSSDFSVSEPAETSAVADTTRGRSQDVD